MSLFTVVNLRLSHFKKNNIDIMKNIKAVNWVFAHIAPDLSEGIKNKT